MNRLMALSAALPALALSGLALTGAALPAVAAPTIVGSYWSETQTCDLVASQCTKSFSTIPAGKRLVVTDVSCLIKHSETSAYIATVMVSPSAGGTTSFFAPVKVGVSGIYNEYVLTSKANVLIPAGQAPHVVVRVGGNILSATIKSTCTFTGSYLSA